MREIPIPCPDPTSGLSICLIGPTIGCSDWQAEVVEYLSGEKINVFNPRPKYAITTNPVLQNNLQTWEREKIIHADSLCFWLPVGGIWAEALIKLGMGLEMAKPIFLGIESNYVQEMYIKSHVIFRRPQQKVHGLVTYMAAEIKTWIYKYYNGASP
jgi:hypothetical protein